MGIVDKAKDFARNSHQNQLRKYTDEPYLVHLEEVAGLVEYYLFNENYIATAFLYDTVEDTSTTFQNIYDLFGPMIGDGVRWLSDMEVGNRSTRKLASRKRLERAPDWVQSIKCADIISNTSCIVRYDPKFSVIFLEEKRLLLDVLTKAEPRILKLAREQCE